MKRESSTLSVSFIVACIFLFCMRAIAQQPLNWPQARTFDTGEETSVSIARNGRYIVEFHQSDSTRKMWYHVGRLAEVYPSGYAVVWGKSHNVDVDGEWPSVTVTQEGYVILVNSPASQVVSQIVYWVGKISTLVEIMKAHLLGFGYLGRASRRDCEHPE